MSDPTPSGGPLVFLVEAVSGDWLQVRLPTSIGGTGWVHVDRVAVSEHAFRVTLDLNRRRLRVTEATSIVLDVPVAVGTKDAPPVGRTFVTDILALSNPRTAYGTHVLTLAGHRATPDQYFRGRGAVAIHGTDDEAVVALGSTPGSVALRPIDVRRLAQTIPVGTPVVITGP